MNNYEKFTDAELVRAVELMVSPEDLTIREVAEAILKTLSYTAEEIKDQIESGEYLNAGAYFDFAANTTKTQKSVA